MPAESTGSDEDPQDAIHVPYIKEVVLQNFMCHGNFKLSLEPSMNVIVGTNGSGKSSILTGIMVALGGRAKTTSRGDALSSLVQTGKLRATISLTIHIPREYRQMHQKYGSEVRITRHIHSGKGGSQYKLRDSQGREVKGSNAQEVSTLCQHFGFYPDNELAMLSQENAKEFLVSASPQVKYEKLRRALLQNVIERDRALVLSHNKEQERLIQRVDILSRSAADKEAKANEVLYQARAQASASAKLRAIKLVLAWRELNEARARVAEAEQDVAKINADIAECESRSNVDAERDRIETERETLTQQRTVLSDRVSDMKGSYEVAQRELGHAKEEYENTLKEVRQLEEQADRHESLIRDSERTAAELTPQAVAQRSAEINLQIQEAERRRAEAAARISKEEAAASDLEGSLAEREARLRQEKDNLRDAERQVSRLQAEIRDLERGNTNVSRVSDAVRNLQHQVDKERWDRKPIGPIYQFVQMNDVGADFAPALERLWTNTLEAWWVETERDRRQLLQLATRCGIRNLRIYKRLDDPFDYSNALPPTSHSYIRATDVIDTELDAIRRILVDLNHIESTVFVHDVSAAFKVTDSRVPRNKVKMAISMTAGPKGNRKYTSVTSIGGRVESSTVAPMMQARMKVGAQARLRQLKSDLQVSESNLIRAKERVEHANKDRRLVQEELTQHREARLKAEAVRRRAEDDGESLNAQLLNLETQAKSSDMGDELRSTRKALNSLKEQIHEGYEALKEQDEVVKERAAIVQSRDQELRGVRKELNDIHAKQQRLLREFSELQHVHRQNVRRLERLETARDERTAQSRSLKVAVDEKVSSCEELGPDPHQDVTHELSAYSQPLLSESTATLESKLNNLRGQQEAINTAEDEIREAELMRKEARQDRERIEVCKNEMLRLLEEIKTRQRNRDDNEARLWSSIKQDIRAVFRKTLSRRSFMGDVDIDDGGSKLVAHATPGQASDRSTSTLSGGEKSFTQVALLMAVWNTMHVGFVAMDEYDVFMDKVNRSLSLQLLAQLVHRRSLQCILITPQDIDKGMLKNINFKVHKLQAARP